MKGVVPLRNTSWLARIASVVTLLALVVAPACAPLCAAQVCTQASVTAGMGSHCHSREVVNESAVHIRAVQNCGAPELQVAELTSASRRGSFQRDRATVSAGELGVLFADHLPPLAHHRVPRSAGLEPPPDSYFSVARV